MYKKETQIIEKLNDWYNKNMLQLVGEERPFSTRALFEASVETGVPMSDFLYGDFRGKQPPQYYDRFTETNIDQKLDQLFPDKNEKHNRCPSCGEKIDWESNGWGGEDNYCKHCGTILKRINVEYDPVRVGANLKKARMNKELRLEDVIKHINYKSASSLSQWESGSVEVPLPVLIKLSVLYDRPLDSLINAYAPNRKKAKPQAAIFVQNDNSTRAYTWKDDDFDEYVPECPCCGEVIDITRREALSHSLDLLKTTIRFSKKNDGHYCKNCGQRINRRFLGDHLKDNIKELERIL